MLLEELADVLTRPAATRQLAVIGKTSREVLADYLVIIELIEPPPLPAPVSREPDDDHVLACALSAPDNERRASAASSPEYARSALRY